MLDFTITVPTKEAAEEICRQWPGETSRNL